MSVQIGQIWGDKDKRRTGRTFKVIDVLNDAAVCDILSKSDGVPKSRNRTKIRLDRFRPKYYALEYDANPVTVVKVPDSTKPITLASVPAIKKLHEECEHILTGTWGSHGSYAIFDNDHITVTVREVRSDCYDIKARIDGHLIYSNVGKADIKTSLGQLKAYLKSLRGNLSDIVE